MKYTMCFIKFKLKLKNCAGQNSAVISMISQSDESRKHVSMVLFPLIPVADKELNLSVAAVFR